MMNIVHTSHELNMWNIMRGNGNPLQYSCLGKSLGQRSLVRYSLWGCRVRCNWVTEHAHTHYKADIFHPRLLHVCPGPCCSNPTTRIFMGISLKIIWGIVWSTMEEGRWNWLWVSIYPWPRVCILWPLRRTMAQGRPE